MTNPLRAFQDALLAQRVASHFAKRVASRPEPSPGSIRYNWNVEEDGPIPPDVTWVYTFQWMMTGTIELKAADEDELEKKIDKLKWTDLKDPKVFTNGDFEVVKTKKLKTARDDEEATWLVTMLWTLQGEFQFTAPDHEEIASEDFYDALESKGGIEKIWRDISGLRYVKDSLTVDETEVIGGPSWGLPGVNAKAVKNAITKARAILIVDGMTAMARKQGLRFSFPDAKEAIELWFDGAKPPKDEKGKAARAYLESDAGQRLLDQVVKATQTELRRQGQTPSVKDVAEYLVRWFG